jgi:N6-adenosine-specific RNA methylase IME4
MGVWGITFKGSAVWVKMKDGKLQRGMGLVFRNTHEILLYGTRGDMPGPQHQPASSFLLPRGKHSAKPPEIRKNIERMYPDFDEKTRLELFAREQVKGWTGYGYEA